MEYRLAWLIDRYRDWLEKKIAAGQREKRTLDYYSQLHAKFLAHVGNVKLDSLRAYDLMTWSSRWHRIQAVQRLFNWAVDADLYPRNPFRKVEKPPAGERRRIFQRREQLVVLRHGNSSFRTFLIFLRESMARPQEGRALTWPDLQTLSSGEECFVLEQFKGKRRRKDQTSVRIIPVSARLSRLLARLRSRAKNPAGHILLNTRGKPWSTNATRCAMRALRRKAGIGLDRRGENIVCYTCRHTSATRATAAGLRDKILAELLGHVSPRTTARYQHLDVEDLLAAFHRHMG